jgi:ApaG protein
MTSAAKRTFGSDTTTHGVRVTVSPSFSADRSDPDHRVFVFLYRIRIVNESDCTVTLLSRRWVIVDADGERQEVQGDGVVGRQPTITPGAAFEYSSTCPLKTPWGTMEGEYTLRRAAKPVDHESQSDSAIGLEPESSLVGPATVIKCAVGRFFLVAEAQPASQV